MEIQTLNLLDVVNEWVNELNYTQNVMNLWGNW